MVGMGILDDGERLLNDAEGQAREHPQLAEKGLGEAEQLADKETGGRFDQQIQDVGAKLGQEFDGQSAPGTQP